MNIAANYPHLALVAAADWSCNPKKRWLALATRQEDGKWQAAAPVQVTEPRSLLADLASLTPQPGAWLLGFDFPIGIPARYAERAGVCSFLEWLLHLGQGVWSDFFQPARHPGEVSLRRPFYPARHGASQRSHLTSGLGLAWEDLYRQCDLGKGKRPTAAALFWTLGARQVGKAAMHGWQHVIQPGLRCQAPAVTLWPFSGALHNLLQPATGVIAEIYPAEYYRMLGVAAGKRKIERRRLNAARLFSYAQKLELALDASLGDQIERGFPDHQGGDDAFDAIIGLFGMLAALRQEPALPEPEDKLIREIEGWILGQEI